MTWRFFVESEFTCKCGCGSNFISHDFVDALDDLRAACGFVLPVTSGYRCPEHNAKVSTTGANGPHTTGLAVDLGVRGDRCLLVLEHALAMGFRGIGLNQKGAARFIHLDMVDRVPRALWTY